MDKECYTYLKNKIPADLGLVLKIENTLNQML
jgi:hypothetical protein